MKRIIIAALAVLTYFASTADTAGRFNERDMSVTNLRDSVRLAGTLVRPTGKEARAGIVLVTGSGAQNRDEEVFGHRPFKVIAETLGEKGYAVLRMDDRGIAESEGDFAAASDAEFESDIASAIAEMRRLHPTIPIGLIGHSSGGSIAIRQASANPDCSFIITLAAPAWQGDSIIMSQSRALSVGLTGSWEREHDQRELMDIVKSDLSDMQARMAIGFALTKLTGDAATLPQVKEMIARQTDALVSPWYRGMIKYDPADDIRSVDKPWLALNGSKDTQVLPGNLLTIKQLNPQAETRELEGLNHLFQHCTTGLVNEYESISEDIAPQVVGIIAEWLDKSGF